MTQPSEPRTLGYFTSSAETIPAFDPGLDVPDVVCWRALREEPRVTISLMWIHDDRSYFFRSHKRCWEALTDREQQRYEESLLP